ncbi:MAG: outer membrane beta-barrel protein [Bacteroidales bacterium]
MKKILLLIFALASVCSLNAQARKMLNLSTYDEKKFHFGFSLAANGYDARITNWATLGTNPNYKPESFAVGNVNPNTVLRADVIGLTPGLTVNLIGSMKLSNDFSLRFTPGLSITTQKIYFNEPIYDIFESAGAIDFYGKRMTWVDFPLLIKYQARRLNNNRPYVIVGGSARYLATKSGQEDLIAFNNIAYYFEAGVGWDSFFSFFKLSTEFKVCIGLNDILDRTWKEQQRNYYTQSISDYYLNIFVLSFHFEM